MSSLQNIKNELTSIANNIEVPSDEIKTPAAILQCIQNSKRMKAYVTSSFFAGINLLYIVIIVLVIGFDKTSEYTPKWNNNGTIAYTKKNTLNLSEKLTTINFINKYPVDITPFRILVGVFIVAFALLITLLDRSIIAADHELEEQYQCQEHRQSSKDVLGLVSTFFGLWVLIVIFCIVYKFKCPWPEFLSVPTFPIFFTIYTITILTAFILSVEGDLWNSINC